MEILVSKKNHKTTWTDSIRLFLYTYDVLKFHSDTNYSLQVLDRHLGLCGHRLCGFLFLPCVRSFRSHSDFMAGKHKFVRLLWNRIQNYGHTTLLVLYIISKLFLEIFLCKNMLKKGTSKKKKLTIITLKTIQKDDSSNYGQVENRISKYYDCLVLTSYRSW